MKNTTNCKGGHCMTYIPEQEITVLWVAESNFQPCGGLKPHAHNYYQLFLVRKARRSTLWGTRNVF